MRRPFGFCFVLLIFCGGRLNSSKSVVHLQGDLHTVSPLMKKLLNLTLVRIHEQILYLLPLILYINPNLHWFKSNMPYLVDRTKSDLSIISGNIKCLFTQTLKMIVFKITKMKVFYVQYLLYRSITYKCSLGHFLNTSCRNGEKMRLISSFLKEYS